MAKDFFSTTKAVKRVTLIMLCALYFVLMCSAQEPEKAIPFIFDNHLYLQATVMDSIDVSLIYDTGADHLYLDEDYMQQSTMGRLPLAKGVAQMGGAGNGGKKQIPIIIEAVTVRAGSTSYVSTITPLINLRDILGRYTDGMIGNNMMLRTPLLINYTDCYLLPVKSLTPAMTEGYTKLPAKFANSRIYVDCELAVDSAQVLKGQFLVDLGCGSTVILTNETQQGLNLDAKNKAYSFTRDNGFGDDGRDVEFRVNSFKLLDTLCNVVISASLNTQGALSSRPYLGIIGNEILCHYDLIIDVPGQAVYARKNGNDDSSYQHSSRVHMSYIDRTDICEGWIVKCLYENGIAQTAGIEIDDIILSINGRPTKDINWEQQRAGLGLDGKTTFTVLKRDGTVKDYVIDIGPEII